MDTILLFPNNCTSTQIANFDADLAEFVDLTPVTRLPGGVTKAELSNTRVLRDEMCETVSAGKREQCAWSACLTHQT